MALARLGEVMGCLGCSVTAHAPHHPASASLQQSIPALPAGPSPAPAQRSQPANPTLAFPLPGRQRVLPGRVPGCSVPVSPGDSVGPAGGAGWG